MIPKDILKGIDTDCMVHASVSHCRGPEVMDLVYYRNGPLCISDLQLMEGALEIAMSRLRRAFGTPIPVCIVLRNEIQKQFPCAYTV